MKTVKGKKNDDDNNNKKIVHNTVVWLRRLRELGFQIAAKFGYPQQQILYELTCVETGLNSGLFPHCDITLQRIKPQKNKPQIFISACILRCIVLLSETIIAS